LIFIFRRTENSCVALTGSILTFSDIADMLSVPHIDHRCNFMGVASIGQIA
jgi:hypothetical protein